MNRSPLLGIDLGGTNCRAALVPRPGEREEFRQMETRIDEGLDSFVDRLERFCRDLLDEGGRVGRRVRAIGIGVPGVIRPDGKIQVSPNLPPLDGVDLAGILGERLGITVKAVNDANAIAWGEALFGAGRRFSSFVALTLGTGVGGGLVLERRLWEGSDGAAGEIGHLVVEPQGRPCGCGSRGCLERYSSASGLVESVRLALERGEESILSALEKKDLTSARVGQAAGEGDAVARSAFDEAGRRLGQVLAALANLLNLDGAVITGGASASLPLMRPALEEELEGRAFAISRRRLRIVQGELGDDAGILGAAELARNALEKG